MPHVEPQVASFMHLYKLCKQFGTLPCEGGILDQDEKIMDKLGFIDDKVQAWRVKRAQEQEGELMKQRMLQGLKHG